MTFISEKYIEISWYGKSKKESSKAHANHGYSYKFDLKIAFNWYLLSTDYVLCLVWSSLNLWVK